MEKMKLENDENENRYFDNFYNFLGPNNDLNNLNMQNNFNQNNYNQNNFNQNNNYQIPDIIYNELTNKYEDNDSNYKTEKTNSEDFEGTSLESNEFN